MDQQVADEQAVIDAMVRKLTDDPDRGRLLLAASLGYAAADPNRFHYAFSTRQGAKVKVAGFVVEPFGVAEIEVALREAEDSVRLTILEAYEAALWERMEVIWGVSPNVTVYLTRETEYGRSRSMTGGPRHNVSVRIDVAHGDRAGTETIRSFGSIWAALKWLWRWNGTLEGLANADG